MTPDEFSSRFSAARAHVRVTWSDDRARRVFSGMKAKRRRRVVVRAGLAAVAALVVGVVAWQRSAAPPPAVALEAPALASLRVEVLTAETQFENGELRVGRIRLHADRNGPRVRVHSGEVEVELSGGRALMERVENVFLHVDEGEAVVRWPRGEARLLAGAEGWYPPHAPAPGEAVEPVRAPPAEALPAVAPVPARPPPPARPVRPVPAWRRLAEQGSYGEAYEALHREQAPISDQPAELLLAADVARLSHHPLDALAPLKQLLERHQDDPRAPLAAFTLGRVLLDELGRPGEADDAFATARRLAPDGSLADDALAREVEARSRSGDLAAARALAQEYLRRLPEGPRAKSVRHYGGLTE